MPTTGAADLTARAIIDANLYLGAGLLSQVRFADGVARFEVQSCAHHHAICTQCGLTEDVPVDLVMPLGSALNRTMGFTLSLDEPLLARDTCRTCTTAKPG